MFGIIKKNFQIQKSLQIAREEFGIDPARAIGSGLASNQSIAWREQARNLIDTLALNDKELAIMFAAPFVSLVTDSFQIQKIRERVEFWLNLGVVRQDIADNILDELRH